jgi:hypothetical protein
MSRYGGCGLGEPISGTIPFVPGSEIIQPFLILAESAIVDIADGTVTAEILTFGSVAFSPVVEIENASPQPEPDQQPHGVVRLTEEQTAMIPDGALLRLVYVQSGVTMPALSWVMKRTV